MLRRMTDQQSHPRDTQDELSPPEPPADGGPADDPRPATDAITSQHAAAVCRPLCAAAVLAALALVSTAGRAAPPQLFGPQDPGRLKVRGGIPVVFSPRPAADGSGRRLAALDAAAVV